MKDNQQNSTFSISISTIGLITFIVFLVLKLCNQGNPDFAWLTWFWVWFPLWIGPAIGLFFLIIMSVLVLIITLNE